jgi:hypothetical protein
MYNVEVLMTGGEAAYAKHNSNAGDVIADQSFGRDGVNRGQGFVRNTPQAYTHFTYETSGRQMIVCDIQVGAGPPQHWGAIHNMESLWWLCSLRTWHCTTRFLVTLTDVLHVHIGCRGPVHRPTSAHRGRRGLRAGELRAGWLAQVPVLPPLQ